MHISINICMKRYDLAWKLVPTSQEDLSGRIKKTPVMWEPIQDPCLGCGKRFPHPSHGASAGPGPM